MASGRLSRAMALAWLLALTAAAASAQDKPAGLASAIAAAQRGDAATAEPVLRALAVDDDEAAAWLGILLVQRGDEASVGEGMILLRRAAFAGNARAKFGLAFQYLTGAGTNRDDIEASRLFREAAEGGIARAAYNHGLMHAHGRGVPHDPAQALMWYERASKAGDPYGTYAWARALETSPQAAQRWGEIAPLYLSAAKAGHLPAAVRYGAMLLEGRGVSRDRARAEFWLRHAADHGFPEAALLMGDLFGQMTMGRSGRQQEEVAKAAASWYLRAAEAGVAMAQAKLGNCYFAGAGVPRDFPTAQRWYRRAAEQGFADAQYVLGIWLSGGVAGTTDPVDGYRWLALAERQGHSNAAKVRARAAEKLTPDQIERAEHAALSFTPRPEHVAHADDEAPILRPPTKVP
ncbi:MAG: sel1 repeat family protein [Alphaproteobacteria bacterium]|nr:sel1 repeat family protein [Alphaproteobacteria bacterium]MCW5740884.1 sel1 repeat family protein [Alphaproteobacteria bacterium]